jgi:2-oxoglutarate dehydrogenase E1 component
MNRSTVANRSNLELIEDNYQRWRDDPTSVDETWQFFFQGYDLGRTGEGRARADADPDASRAQAAVTRLIDAYREMGHYLADLDPLGLTPRRNSHELLELSAFGLTEADLDRTFYTKMVDPPYTTLRDLIDVLRETYCRTIGVEFMHIRNTQIRTWLQDRMEQSRNRPQLDIRRKRRIILKLNAAESFETFLHSHYIGQKRFSLEGGETLIARS